MKIIRAVPSTPTIEREDFRLVFSPFQSAAGAAWDEVSPDEADYIIVPYHLKAYLNGPDARPRCLLGGDIVLPFVFGNRAANGEARRAQIRTSILEAFLGAFPSYARYPAKHIFFDTGDMDRPCPVLCDSILFKKNVSYRDRSVLPVPHPVADPGEPFSITRADLDISFCGLLSQHPIRERLALERRKWKDLKIDFRDTKRTIYSVDLRRRTQMARDAFDLMLRSRFVLSPRGVGTSSRRFYEILAHGRIPILVSDCFKLPLESVIDYDKFIVRVPEGFVSFTAQYVREFEASHDLAEASTLARRTFVEYFAPDRFRSFIEASIATREP